MGAFRPDEITRSEVAAVAARIVDPSLRVPFSLYAPLYVGFTIPADNAGKVGITGLTMTTDGAFLLSDHGLQKPGKPFFSLS